MCKPTENSRMAYNKFIKQLRDALKEGPSTFENLPTHPKTTPYAHNGSHASPVHCPGALPTSPKTHHDRKPGARRTHDSLHPGRVISKAPKPKFVCKECGKSYKRASNLKVHDRLHKGVRPYKCPFVNCDKEFCWKNSFVSHVKWHRTELGQELPGDISAHPLTTERARDNKKSYQMPPGWGVFGLGSRIDGLGMARIVNASMGFNPGSETSNEKGDGEGDGKGKVQNATDVATLPN